MFFALSTGRAGSRTLAAVLSQSPTCTCLHEPHPQLIEESARFRYGELPPAELSRALRASRRDPEGGVYGETSNRLALIVPVLRETFPEARYVWLVRDGRDMVSSAVQRGWFDLQQPGYPPNEWERWRVRGDLVGDVPTGDWAAWTPFRRVCWLWAYTNRLIRDDLVAAGIERPTVVRLERLPEELDALADSLGIDRADWLVGRANARGAAEEVAPLERANVVDRVWRWPDWTAEQREDFDSLCGTLMDELYQGWRGDHGTWRPSPVEAGPRERSRAGSDLAAVRSDLAELKLIRGDLQALVAHHRRTVDGYDRRLDAAHEAARAVAEEAGALRERVAAAERSTHELRQQLPRAQEEAQQLREQLPRAQEEAQQLREQLARAQEEAQQLRERLSTAAAEVRSHEKAWRTSRERLIRLETSPSYRLGTAVTGTLRRLSRGRVGDQAVTRAYERLQSNERVRAVLGIDEAGPGTARAAPGQRRGAVPPVPGGRGLDPAAAAQLPVALVLLLGLDGDAVDRCVDEVAAAQLMQPSFRPLFVIDTDRFGLLREHGYLFEYLPPETDLRPTPAGEDYAGLVVDRVSRIVQTYGAATVLAPPHGTALTTALAASVHP